MVLGALLGLAAPLLGGLLGGNKREGQGIHRRRFRKGKGFKGMAKMAATEAAAGTLANVGSNLADRLINKIMPQQGMGIKNFKISHGLGAFDAPNVPAPFGGMIGKLYKAPAINWQPRAAITGNPMSSQLVPRTPRTIAKSGAMNNALPNRGTMNTIGNRTIAKRAPQTMSMARGPSAAPTGRRDSPITMRPMLKSRPSTIIPKVKQFGSKVKRLGRRALSGAKNMAKRGLNYVKSGKARSALRSLKSPLQYTRRLARKGALKLGSAGSRLTKYGESGQRNKLARRAARKTGRLATRASNKMDYFGQLGNMGARQSKSMSRIKSGMKTGKRIATRLAKRGLKSFKKGGRRFTTSKKTGRGGAPYVPGPLP